MSTKYFIHRWLSLHKALVRLIDNWQVLEDFFKAEREGIKKRKSESKASSTCRKRIKTTVTSVLRPNDSLISQSPARKETLGKKVTCMKSSVPSAHTNPPKSTESSSQKGFWPEKSTRAPVSASCVKQFDVAGHIFRQEAIAKLQMAKKKVMKQSESYLQQTKVTSTKVPGSKKKCGDSPNAKSWKPLQKSELIYNKLSSPDYKLYALFLKSVIPFFEQLNQVCIVYKF